MADLPFSATQWPAVSPLLDEALDLAQPERADWLARLNREHPELATIIRTLFAAHVRCETDDFLEQGPALSPGAPDAPEAIAEPADALNVGDVIGPYRLLRPLGSGGMALVWLARRIDASPARDVALKIPQRYVWRQGLAERFTRERDILARLAHPHIARLYDAGVSAPDGPGAGLPYLVLEYVQGSSLTAYCDTHRLVTAQRLALMLQVLEAVQYAHARLVIHRDLKPANILVTEEGQVRLLDFGVAKLLADAEGAEDAERTQLTQLTGRAFTPDYASPEQVRGEPLGTASDVYSLGVVLYELLCGQRPYRLAHASVAQLEQAIVEVEPAPPSSHVTTAAAECRNTTSRRLQRELRGELDTILLKALKKKPEQRYGTVAELAEDLRRHRDGEPVLARPESRLYRLSKFVVRNRLAMGASGLVAAALVAGTAVSLWQARAAARETRVAQQQAGRAEEVKRLVLSIFQDANPYGGAGKDITAVELLRQARDRLAATPVSDPRTQVELHTTLGVALRAIGAYPLSLEILRDTAGLASRELAADDPTRLDAQLHLGWSAVFLGELEVAQLALADAERGRRALQDAAGLSAVLIARSELVKDQGDGAQALDLAQEALRLAETSAQRNGDQRVVIDALVAVCNRLSGLGRPGQLEPARRARDLARQVFGERATDLALDARRVHASALIEEGDLLAGVAEMRAIARERTRLSGELHHAVAVSHGEISRALFSYGDLAGALAAREEALRLTRAQGGGKPSSEIANAVYNLGVVLAAARRPDAAIARFQEAIDLHRTLGRPDHVVALLARSAMAMELLLLDRRAEAEALLKEVQASPDPDPQHRAALGWRLGVLRSGEGRHDEAVALLEEAAAGFSTRSTRYHAAALHSLGRALLAAGRPAQALDVLARAQGVLAPRQPAGSPDLADLSVDLARAQLALERPADAARAAASGATFWQAFDPANRRAGLADLWAARALAQAGSATQARAALQRADAVLRASTVPSDRALLADARREVGGRGGR